MLIAFLVATLLVTLSIVIHYETLLRLSSFMKRMHVKPRIRIVVGLVGALAAHVVEIWVFTFGYYFLGYFEQTGSLEGTFNYTLTDYAYFSFSTYTSLGFGDIVPLGPMRFVAGMEVLLGLVLIAWTASFMYVQMERFWKV